MSARCEAGLYGSGSSSRRGVRLAAVEQSKEARRAAEGRLSAAGGVALQAEVAVSASCLRMPASSRGPVQRDLVAPGGCPVAQGGASGGGPGGQDAPAAQGSVVRRHSDNGAHCIVTRRRGVMARRSLNACVVRLAGTLASVIIGSTSAPAQTFSEIYSRFGPLGPLSKGPRKNNFPRSSCSLAVEHTGSATLVTQRPAPTNEGDFLDSEGCSPSGLWHHCGNVKPAMVP